MNPATLIAETVHRVPCPHCGKPAGTIDHLLGGDREWGPWYCDSCGGAYAGRTKAGAVFVEAHPDRKIETSVLLRIDPQTVPIYLLVAGMRFTGRSQPDNRVEHARYFYEEHTCPTNYLRDVWAMAVDGETDPHGIAAFVSERDGAPSRTEHDAEILRAVLEAEGLPPEERSAP